MRRSTNFSAKRPLVAGDVVIVGNSIADSGRGTIGNERNRLLPPGDVQAYDVRTGRKLWTFHTVPKEYEAGYETWLNGSAEHTGNANVWAGMAYDAELDYVYMATSTPTNDTYGGDRPGDNLYAESIVCVEARTGERVWHFQAIHHGLWDYDFASMPVLGAITVDGQAHRRRHGRQQAGVHLRLRPGDRRARLAHRGAARAGVDRPRASRRRRPSRSRRSRRRSTCRAPPSRT